MHDCGMTGKLATLKATNADSGKCVEVLPVSPSNHPPFRNTTDEETLANVLMLIRVQRTIAVYLERLEEW